MATRRFFVRRQDGRWIFGRDDLPFASYATKERAVRLAEKFLRQYPDAELVVDDDERQDRAARG